MPPTAPTHPITMPKKTSSLRRMKSAVYWGAALASTGAPSACTQSTESKQRVAEAHRTMSKGIACRIAMCVFLPTWPCCLSLLPPEGAGDAPAAARSGPLRTGTGRLLGCGTGGFRGIRDLQQRRRTAYVWRLDLGCTLRGVAKNSSCITCTHIHWPYLKRGSKRGWEKPGLLLVEALCGWKQLACIADTIGLLCDLATRPVLDTCNHTQPDVCQRYSYATSAHSELNCGHYRGDLKCPVQDGQLKATPWADRPKL